MDVNVKSIDFGSDTKDGKTLQDAIEKELEDSKNEWKKEKVWW